MKHGWWRIYHSAQCNAAKGVTSGGFVIASKLELLKFMRGKYEA